MSKRNYVCGSCGSENIEFHGFMMWDKDMQRMYSTDYNDEIYCLECDNNTHYLRTRILEVPINIKVI